jgi:Fanconi anemia group M protein
MSTHAEIMKIKHAVEIVETQSVEALDRYFDRQQNAARSSGASKATQRFVSDPEVRRAMEAARSYDELHPKYRQVRILLAQTLGVGDGERVIVFTESRDTAESLTDFLGEHFTAQRFVGQTEKEHSAGMTQTEQTAVLEDFRAGEFEVLVSTSVGEEGLDVPEVDLVCFFEPVPNAIRSIQRRGRTGRQERGRVVVLVAQDTRDEAYYWISKRREKQMAEDLEALKADAEAIEAEYGQTKLDQYADAGTETTAEEQSDGSGSGTGPQRSAENEAAAASASDENDQAGIADFEPAGEETGDADGTGDDEHGADEDDADENSDEEGVVATAGGDETVEIVVDQRELDASIARTLNSTEGVETRLETLAVGDYVCSDRVAVERKAVPDFLATLFDGDRDLFDQVGDLASHYGRPVLVIEGEADLYGERNVHPNAIRGALASLAVDFGISVLFTRDEDDTARLLETIARREQESGSREVSVHGTSAAKTLPEQQEYVVASIADVGPVTARSLLADLGSVEAVLTADAEALQSVDGVGEVTADRIREVVGSEYDPR